MLLRHVVKFSAARLAPLSSGGRAIDTAIDRASDQHTQVSPLGEPKSMTSCFLPCNLALALSEATKGTSLGYYRISPSAYVPLVSLLCPT